MKNVLAMMMIATLCWGCTKEQASSGGQGASGVSPEGGRPLVVVNFAEIVPSNPTAESMLSIQFTTASGDTRPELFSFKWYVDGAAVEGASGNQMAPGQLRKGSTVEVELVPTDGKRTGAPFRTKPVVIKNTPPVASSAAIRPVPAYVGDSIGIAAEATDRDGDQVTFQVQWMVNSASVAGSEQGQLNTAGLKKKDRISAMVTPFDGADRGAPLASNYLTLSNRNPDITSTPPSGLQNGSFVYQVTANDADGDTITYSLAAAPAGMTIDKSSGLIKWEIPAVTERQQVNVKVSADDGDGGVSYQEFSMNLEKR